MPILTTDVTYCNTLPLTPVTIFLHFEQFNAIFLILNRLQTRALFNLTPIC